MKALNGFLGYILCSCQGWVLAEPLCIWVQLQACGCICTKDFLVLEDGTHVLCRRSDWLPVKSFIFLWIQLTSNILLSSFESSVNICHETTWLCSGKRFLFLRMRRCSSLRYWFLKDTRGVASSTPSNNVLTILVFFTGRSQSVT